MPPPCEGEQHVAPSPQSAAPEQPIFVQMPGPVPVASSAEHARLDGHSPPPIVQGAPMPSEFGVTLQAAASPAPPSGGFALQHVR